MYHVRGGVARVARPKGKRADVVSSEVPTPFLCFIIHQSGVCIPSLKMRLGPIVYSADFLDTCGKYEELVCLGDWKLENTGSLWSIKNPGVVYYIEYAQLNSCFIVIILLFSIDRELKRRAYD